ncbi:SusC/RagA family TonB-linked outer membrane protein [Pedobacter metabolipauper]|uniref:TonB-linked SusC/RagA family outer membrane protein n=1 Tax=Pedobacter metabolipauper TaxID=425513 RepID=A0A4V3D1F0_9SPHI|nr:TonB-dependent receptor [Pedobacter metabolipauper]TDQ10347.1 TonB-linked SusC/RagA family outer membrane protein [Pedobacter metabolipauper]
MKRIFTKFSVLTFLCFLLINSAFAQNITVRGVVTDDDDKTSLPGVSILVKGTQTGTQTDATGSYSINAPANATLVFSYIGYTIKEVAVNNQTTINVALAPSSQSLEAVVVVGYGTQRKIDVTGAVANVKGEEISKQASTNALSALQGKVAGVQITNSGSPGSSPQIRIRGVGSVYGSVNPLYVVDGVWYDDISFLNPNDVESMSILKDASSQSIYGVRAANGVVLITTKKGKGKTTVSYDGYVGYQRATNQVDMANGTEYATLINEQNSVQQKPLSFSNTAQYGEGTNWLNVILRDALQTNHNVTVGGSAEKSSYSFSAGYLKQEGIIKTNDFERFTGRFTGDFTPVDYIKLGYNVILQSNQSADLPGGIVYKAYTAAPVVPQFYADGSYGDPNDYPVGSQPNNPRAQLDFFDQNSKNYRVTGNVFAELKIIKDLTLRTSFGGEFGNGEVVGYNPVYKATQVQRNDNSLLSISRAETRNWIIENTLTYNKILGDHRFTLLAGQTAQRYKSYALTASAYNVPNTRDGDRYLTLGTPNGQNAQFPRSINDSGDMSTAASYFGRVNYSFKNRYLLNASLRADGSSKFTGDQRWGYFPSVGAGWIISDEDFMKDQKLFNTLKFRGSFGIVGNSGVPTNLSTILVDQKGQFTAIYNGQPAQGGSITSIVPPVTYWEKGQGIDLAVEGTSLNNRLNFELDFYEKKTLNGIFDIPVLGSIGTSGSSIIGNQASFRNRGVELTLGWNEKLENGFSYALNGNFSINNNTVLSTETGANPIFAGGSAATSGLLSTRTIVGQPIGQFFGLLVDGIFQNTAEIANSAQSASARPGDFKYADINGDGIINLKDRVSLGNPSPKYTYGFNTSFAYKNFDLAVDFQGVAGVKVYNANKGLRFGAENYSKDFFDNRWHGEGTSNSYPSADIGGGQNANPNSWYVEDGSYFRIRNIQLGYNLPASLMSKLKLQRIRVFADAQNAFNFFKYTGFSPEVSGGNPVNAGIDNSVYPLSATYRFGLNVTF